MENRIDITQNYKPASPFVYGVFLAIISIVIFALAKLLGFEQMVWLRFINYTIFFVVAYAALKKVFKQNEKINYFNGLRIAFLVGFWGQLFFSIFFYAYLHFDQSLLEYIKTTLPGSLLYPELSISFLLLCL